MRLALNSRCMLGRLEGFPEACIYPRLQMQFDAATGTFANAPGVNTSISDFGGQFCAPIPYEPLFVVAQAIGYTSGWQLLLSNENKHIVAPCSVLHPWLAILPSCMTFVTHNIAGPERERRSVHKLVRDVADCHIPSRLILAMRHSRLMLLNSSSALQPHILEPD